MLILMKSIEVHPDVCNGRAVIRNTRITVSTVLGFLSAGDSVDSILEGYPQLSREDVFGLIKAGVNLTDQLQIHLIPSFPHRPETRNPMTDPVLLKIPIQP